MIVMIFTAIATMIWTGYLNGGTNLVEDFANCSSSESLVFAGLVTVGFLLLFYLPRRVIGFKDFMNSVPEGGKLMMPPILILVLAWTLKGMTDALGIGDFVRQAVSLNEGLMRFVPLLIFCIAIFIAFSSGTSWGTFAILVPIVVNMFTGDGPHHDDRSGIPRCWRARSAATIFRQSRIRPSCPAPAHSRTTSTTCRPRCSTPWSSWRPVCPAT